MSGAEIMYAVSFIVTLMGFAFGLWKYVDSKISTVRDELQKHELNVAQNYVTKAGMQEQTSQLLRAIESIAGRIDSISERLDRVIEARASRPRS